MTRYKFMEVGMGGGPEGDIIQQFIVPEDMPGQDLMAAVLGMLPEDQTDAIYDRILAVCESREKAQLVVDAMNKASAS